MLVFLDGTGWRWASGLRGCRAGVMKLDPEQAFLFELLIVKLAIIALFFLFVFALTSRGC